MTSTLTTAASVLSAVLKRHFWKIIQQEKTTTAENIECLKTLWSHNLIDSLMMKGSLRYFNTGVNAARMQRDLPNLSRTGHSIRKEKVAETQQQCGLTLRGLNVNPLAVAVPVSTSRGTGTSADRLTVTSRVAVTACLQQAAADQVQSVSSRTCVCPHKHTETLRLSHLNAQHLAVSRLESMKRWIQ